jgi:hypothetical protein
MRLILDRFKLQSTSHKTEMPAIINDSYKERPIQMLAGATFTGNVTINFSRIKIKSVTLTFN